jgi:hypothetical protein
LGIFVVALSCCSRAGSSPPPSGAADANDEATGPAPAADGGEDGGGDAELDAQASAPQSFLRVAQASPDAPPLDVCVAPHGTGVFQGPLVGQFAAAAAGDAGGSGDSAVPADAGAIGLAYAQVSAYVPVAPGQYDVRLVAAGATSCSVPLALAGPVVADDAGEAADASSASIVDGAVEAGADAAGDEAGSVPDWNNLPALAANAYATLLVAGDFSLVGSDAPLGLTIMADDAVLAGAAVALRAVNAVPSVPALDFDLGPPAGSDAGLLPLFTDVRFGVASSQTALGDGVLDANGYLPTAPLLARVVIARPSADDASGDTAVAGNVEVDEGSIATFFAIGGKTGDALRPPSLLLCVDNTPPGGILSDCSVAQP